MPKTIGQYKKGLKSKKRQQSEFIRLFEEYASVSRAARKAKISRSNIYQWLKTDLHFKDRYEAACEVAVKVLEDEAIRRAVEGNNKPVYQGGKRVGVIREYSDILLMFLLKGLSPEKFKERYEHTGKGGSDLFSSKSDDELKGLLKELSSKLDDK